MWKPSFGQSHFTCVDLTLKSYLPVVLMEIPVASSSGMHVLVQAAGSCTLETASLISICNPHLLLLFNLQFCTDVRCDFRDQYVICSQIMLRSESAGGGSCQVLVFFFHYRLASILTNVFPCINSAFCYL